LECITSGNYIANHALYATSGGANGWELTGDSASGTGSKGNAKKIRPLSVGSLFLQSHWGSLVEYKNPLIERLT